jgi:hypothetical protein
VLHRDDAAEITVQDLTNLAGDVFTVPRRAPEQFFYRYLAKS